MVNLKSCLLSCFVPSNNDSPPKKCFFLPSVDFKPTYWRICVWAPQKYVRYKLVFDGRLSYNFELTTPLPFRAPNLRTFGVLRVLRIDVLVSHCSYPASHVSEGDFYTTTAFLRMRDFYICYVFVDGSPMRKNSASKLKINEYKWKCDGRCVRKLILTNTSLWPLAAKQRTRPPLHTLGELARTNPRRPSLRKNTLTVSSQVTVAQCESIQRIHESFC